VSGGSFSDIGNHDFICGHQLKDELVSFGPTTSTILLNYMHECCPHGMIFIGSSIRIGSKLSLQIIEITLKGLKEYWPPTSWILYVSSKKGVKRMMKKCPSLKDFIDNLFL
jgi:hypothetical protein